MPLITIALFKCPACTRTARVEVPVPDISWLTNTAMQQTELHCDNCGARFSATVNNSSFRYEVTLDDHPAIEVFSSELTDSTNRLPDGLSWLNPGVPNDPFFEFISGYNHMAEVLHAYGVGGGGALKSSASEINKLVLSGLVSAMEAYLSNTIMLLVSEEYDATVNLLLKEKTLSSEKITLYESWSNPGVVEDRIQNYLRRQLYHNLGKVEELYGIAFNVDVFSDSDLKKRLHRTVELRHDIVHRNGRSGQGQEQDFSSETVCAMMKDIYDFVIHINTQLFKHDQKNIKDCGT